MAVTMSSVNLYDPMFMQNVDIERDIDIDMDTRYMYIIYMCITPPFLKPIGLVFLLPQSSLIGSPN